MSFHEGDLVVVPGCGVGEIDAVEMMDVGEGSVELFRIHLGGDDARIWVPVHRMAEERIRPILDASQVDDIWTVIESQEAPEKRANWNRRKRRYDATLVENDPRALAAVLGELAAVQVGKSLSFHERRLFERLREMIIDEIAAARGKARG